MAVIEGGGDLSLGEVGQDGELWPDFETLSGLAPSRTPSTPACIWGRCADIARCIAAAEGIDTKEVLSVLGLVGLNS